MRVNRDGAQEFKSYSKEDKVTFRMGNKYAKSDQKKR